MAKDTTTKGEHLEDKAKASDKKATAKKTAKKKSKKKSAGKKGKAVETRAAIESGVPDRAPEPPAAPIPRPQPADTSISYETRSGGPMRGIVALWGPLAIIVLLIVITRIGDEDPGELAERAAAGLSSSLDKAESVALDVVEDVQDALTGGDPQAAAALGTGGAGSTGSDLAAAFQDAGVASPPAALPPAPQAAGGEHPWRGDAAQTTTPASLSTIPGAPPPQPENPWAPVDPRSAAVPADPYAIPPGGIPAPGAPAGGYGYAGGYAGEPPPPGAYPPPGQGYSALPPGYGAAPPPGYRAPGYSQQPAYGAPPPGYAQPPAYGAPPGYAYPPQPYGAPQPYPPGYYPPAQ